jgi:archaeosortase A (PGF-CTERM-specific)
MIGLEYLALISCAGFLAFLIPGRHRKYTAIVGWIFIVLTLFSLLPEYIRENNFMYPLFAVLSIPFLYITIRYLMKEDERVLNLSRGAAVAFLIYAPFGFDQVPLFASTGNWLIGVVAGQVAWILDALNFTVSLTCMNPATQRAMDIQFCGDAIRNTLTRNNLSVEIILGCTGIQSIAIMLGVAAAVPTTLRRYISSTSSGMPL